MGQDKALLPVGGVPLAARTAAVLRDGGCAAVHLVGRQPALEALGWPVIAEPEADYHPLFGVAAALQAADTPRILIAPCDLPHLQPRHIAELLAVGGPCLAQGQPLLCVLPTAWAQRIQRAAQQGASARAVTAALPRVHLPAHALHNANTPADLG